MSTPKPERSSKDPVVRAAGGIVQRPLPTRRRRFRRSRPPDYEIAVVHRPRYDDWSFPKGKRDNDERDEETALREVEEETGIRCRLGSELGETRYQDSRGRQKVVRYWLMEPVEGGDRDRFVPNREVDELRWLEPDDAGRLLTYQHDLELLDRLPRRGHPRR